jgi:hypothetical protein
MRLAVIATVGIIGWMVKGSTASASCSSCVWTTGGTIEKARLRRTSASATRISTTDSPLIVFSAAVSGLVLAAVSIAVGKLLQADNVREINKILMVV